MEKTKGCWKCQRSKQDSLHLLGHLPCQLAFTSSALEVTSEPQLVCNLLVKFSCEGSLRVTPCLWWAAAAAGNLAPFLPSHTILGPSVGCTPYPFLIIHPASFLSPPTFPGAHKNNFLCKEKKVTKLTRSGKFKTCFLLKREIAKRSLGWDSKKWNCSIRSPVYKHMMAMATKVPKHDRLVQHTCTHHDKWWHAQYWVFVVMLYWFTEISMDRSTEQDDLKKKN